MTLVEKELWQRVDNALDRVRPAIQADGGDVELAEVNAQDGTASVRMLGACVRCPMSHVTLQMGIAHVIRENVPEISYVVALPWEDDDIAFV
ncbi:MAG: NifU family protein [Armatimonadetes bacterium]|nr:NifU family protein [Armatimonadota bacterium]